MIDHGAGNLVSIAQGLERTGAEVVVVNRPADLDDAAGVVLPGVGATGAAMQRLDALGFSEALPQLDVPLLGICVGLQVFFQSSDEDGNRCLGLIEGTVERLRDAPRLPHIGWNDLIVLRDDPLFRDLPPRPTFYFVHSFAPVPANRAEVLAEAVYGRAFAAAVRSGQRVGVQFHPERSGRNGMRVMSNFVRMCREVADAA